MNLTSVLQVVIALRHRRVYSSIVFDYILWLPSHVKPVSTIAMKQRFDNQYPICNSSFDYTYDLLEQQNRAFRHIGIRSWLDEDSLFDHHFISRSVGRHLLTRSLFSCRIHYNCTHCDASGRTSDAVCNHDTCVMIIVQWLHSTWMTNHRTKTIVEIKSTSNVRKQPISPSSSADN